MPDPEPNPDLLPSLGRVVRGLSLLFWCLPLTLLVYVQTGATDIYNPRRWLALDPSIGGWLQWLEPVPAFAVTAFLWLAVRQLGHFQKHDRAWSRELDRGRFLLMVNLGLVPFLVFHHRAPFVPVNDASVALLGVSSILFLHRTNVILGRLADLLPDEALRHEAALFTNFNRTVLAAIPVLLACSWVLERIQSLPPMLARVALGLEELGPWFLVFLILLPTAMTMTLMWKMKEFILNSAFAGR
jgi:hypothetical protein